MFFYNKKIFDRCFCWNRRYWYKNIKNIPLYFKLMHHLIKYGYDEYAIWETFDWFIDTMRSILPNYHKSIGTPILVDNFPDVIQSDEDQKIEDDNRSKWDGIIDRMIELLDLMDENNIVYDGVDFREQHSKMSAAKDEFFELFSKYFYDLWD